MDYFCEKHHLRCLTAFCICLWCYGPFFGFCLFTLLDRNLNFFYNVKMHSMHFQMIMDENNDINRIIVTQKEIVWIHRSFSWNFRNLSTIAEWLFTEGTDLFQGAPGCGILAFLDNMLITIVTAKQCRD